MKPTNESLKTIKCDYFVIVGYPYQNECYITIDVPNDFEKACKVMNDAGWRKCGNRGQWGYFCPQHAELNQFYQNPELVKSIRSNAEKEK